MSFRYDEVLPTVGRTRASVRAFEGLEARPRGDTLGLGVGVGGYNIALRDGVLCAPMGISRACSGTGEEQVTLDGLNYYGEKIRAFYHFRGGPGGELMILHGQATGTLYRMDLTTGDTRPIENMPPIPDGISLLQYYFRGKETLLIFVSSGGMYTYDGVTDPVHYPDVPGLSSVCMHYHRVYGVDGENTLYFSDDLDPTNWNQSLTEGGYVSMMDEGGKLHTVIEWNNYLFLFREHSVWRMVAYTDQSDFQLTKVYVTDHQIRPNTIAVCGNCVVFWSDKFYRFNGFELTPFFEGMAPLVVSADAAAATYYDDAYYFACRVGAEDGPVGDEEHPHVNNALLRLDMGGKEFALLRGADVACIVPFIWGAQSRLFVSFGNFRGAFLGQVDRSGAVFDNPLHKKFVSATTDLGDCERFKVWRDVWVKAPYPFTFTAVVDGKEVVRTARGRQDGRAQWLRLNAVGDRVGYVLESDAEALAVNGLTANFDVCRRYYGNGTDPERVV